MQGITTSSFWENFPLIISTQLMGTLLKTPGTKLLKDTAHGGIYYLYLLILAWEKLYWWGIWYNSVDDKAVASRSGGQIIESSHFHFFSIFHFLGNFLKEEG
jgi:hypothetical protein